MPASWLEHRIPPLLLVLLSALAMAACAGLLGEYSLHFAGQGKLAGLVMLLGISVMLAAAIQFRRARTTVDPRSPEAASALVTGGVFRFSRNPMYLGMALLLLGWGLFLGNLPGLLLVAGFVIWINRFQIAPEERALAARFGPAFARYCGETRRWI